MNERGAMKERLVAAGLFSGTAALYMAGHNLVSVGFFLLDALIGSVGVVAAGGVGFGVAPVMVRRAQRVRSPRGMTTAGAWAGIAVALLSIVIAMATVALAASFGMVWEASPEGAGLIDTSRMLVSLVLSTLTFTLVGMLFGSLTYWPALLFGAGAGVVYYRWVRKGALSATAMNDSVS